MTDAVNADFLPKTTDLACPPITGDHNHKFAERKNIPRFLPFEV